MSFEEQLNALYNSIVLVRVPQLDNLYGVPNKDEHNPEVHVLDLGRTPTGTFKDFRNASIMSFLFDAINNSYFRQKIHIATITSGNNGRSLEYWVNAANDFLGNRFVAHVFVDQKSDYVPLSANSKVYRIDLSKMIDISSLTKSLHVQNPDGIVIFDEFLVNDFFNREEKDVSPLERDIHKFVRTKLNQLFRDKFRDLNGRSFVFCPWGNGELTYLLSNYFDDSDVVACTVSGNPLGAFLLDVPYSLDQDFNLNYLDFCAEPLMVVENMNTIQELKERVPNLLEKLKGKKYKDPRVAKLFVDRIRGRGFSFFGQLFHSRELDRSFEYVWDFLDNVPVSVADKLVCPCSDFFYTLTRAGSFVERVNPLVLADAEIIEEQIRLKDLGFSCEPSAAVGAAGARFLRNYYHLNRALCLSSKSKIQDVSIGCYAPNIIVVNTGKGKDYSCRQKV